MTRQVLPAGHPPFARFERLASSAFRLECLPSYGGSVDDPLFAAFLAGEPLVVSPDVQEWLRMLRANRAAGRHQRRVHVVSEPLSEYLRFELTWMYGVTVPAGEDIRILVGEFDSPDFWLIDDTEVYWMRYDPAGMWVGAEWTDDLDDVTRAQRTRDQVWASAQPWAEFIAARPALAALLPA